MENRQALGSSRAAPWATMKLLAQDLGFSLAEVPGPWLVGVAPSWAWGKIAPGGEVSAPDLTSLQVENDWLIKTCRDYVEALARAGNALGLDGWVVVSECSGVILEAGALAAAGGKSERRSYRVPAVGQAFSFRVAGVNPISLALDQAGVALLPPDEGTGRAPGGTTGITKGLGVPLGEPPVPLGCLAVLVPDHPQEACQALFGQALFSARAINLALALRQERQANLEVAAGMAHEIKNPLTAVKGFLELTLAHRMEVPEYAGVALRELDRAISLLEDYCLFSRGPRIIPTQAVALDGLLAEAALVARGLVASGPPVTVASLGADPDLFIHADPPRIKQVLLNLCRNAVEAMPGGGVLTLGGRAEGGEVVIEVSDTGVGVPPSMAGRIFEPFYTTKQTGTGLGLAVCRRVVEAHGGRITLTSQPGQGTTFQVRLPLHAMTP